MKTTRRPFIRSTSRWIPFGLLGLSLTASIAVAAVVHRLVHMIDERRFARHVQINHDRVVGRLDIYVSVLRATKGLFAAEEDVTLAKFRSFAEQLELRTLYPGIQGIGFVQRVLAAKREEFVTECRAEFPGFRIWPSHSTDDHYVVRYLDPLDGMNAAAIGYDMSSESVRLEAIERARATDAPAMSGKVTLVQEQLDARRQAGVLLFVPLYRYAEGQSTFVGVASAPLRADDLFRGIFGSESVPTIAFTVYDETFAPENILHASAGTTLRDGRGFVATDSLEIAGRRWVVRYAATEAFMTPSLQWLPWAILVVGGVLGSALSLMSVAQARGQRELQESEEHTRAIVESALDAVITIDDHDRITDWNRQAEAIFGWTKDEAMGRQLAQLIIPSGERAAHLHGIQRYLATGVGPVLNRRIELSALRRDGSEFPVELSISPSRVHGKISFTGYLRDITERKRSQEAMKLHSLVLERMVEGVSVADEKGIIVYTNAAEDSIFGYAPGELIGQPVTVQNALPPEENERLVGEVIATLQRDGSWSGEWRNRRKDGTAFITSAHINTLEQDGHRLFVCVQQDITESKLAAQAAEAKHRILETVLEASPVGICVAAASGLVLRTNPAFHRIWGDNAPLAASVSEYRAYRGWFGVDGDRPVEPHEWPMSRALHGEIVDPQIFAIEPFHAPGTRRSIALSAAPVRDAAGAITGAVAMLFDLSEVIAAQEAVRASEARFRAAVSAVSSILWSNNARGEMEGEQTGWGAFTGQAFAEYQGFGWANAVHPEDAQPTIDAWSLAVAERRMFVFEHRVRRRDGVWRRFSIRAVPVLGADGGIREWVGVHTDITEERHLVVALQENEQRFRAMADNIAQLAWTADATGYIFWYNQRWYEYTGTTFEQMQGWGWQAVHDPSHVDRVTDKFRTHLASGMPWEDTFPIRAADGRYRWFLSRAFPIRNEHGEVTLWFGTNTDVTEQMDAESALRRSNAELEQFVYVAAHDLQEPLRNISVSGDMADRKLGAGDPSRQYLARMRESALRMQRLIADLLTYSRVIHHDDSGAQEADVNAAFADAVALLAERISETGSVITCDSLPRVRANPGQMVIVLQNLLANAMKYQPPGAIPRIHVSGTRQHTDATITVSDNGIGFKPEYAHRIFGLFKRLHTDRYEGTGLGLAVCRRIVERYHGRISAESPGEGMGATFSITLPSAGAET